MKDSDLTKLCTERRKAQQEHAGLLARHEEAGRAHQERLAQYHQDLARHQALVQQAQREAYQHQQVSAEMNISKEICNGESKANQQTSVKLWNTPYFLISPVSS